MFVSISIRQPNLVHASEHTSGGDVVQGSFSAEEFIKVAANKSVGKVAWRPSGALIRPIAGLALMDSRQPGVRQLYHAL